MADTFTVEERSLIMRKVKSSRNLSTEGKLIGLFRDRSVKGWRRNWKLFGKPDFVFPRLKIAVFVDGCFWHGHQCRNVSPRNNQEYWTRKIQRNIKRDRLVNKTLVAAGWSVFRIRECELKKGDVLSVRKLIAAIRAQQR